ncbi:MAG TPA: ATP-binding protein [Arachnia sp.]|nr:ATP-binding protein [Arachnia sp.]
MAPSDVDRALSASPADAVRELLTLPEGQWFERKSGRISPKDAAIAMVALANADGGILVIGLHDGVVDGVTGQRVNDLRQTSFDHTVPPVRAHVTELHVEDAREHPATVLIIRIDPGDQVHTLTNGQCYLRVGDESRRLTAAQHQELMFDRGSAPYDSTPTTLHPSELDQEQLAAYASSIGSSSVEAMLRARDLLNRRDQLRVAAVLLFDPHPQTEFPSAYVRVLRYSDTERGVGSSMMLEEGADLRFEGSLPEQIRNAAAAMDDLIPKWRRLGDSGRFEPTHKIPRPAWMEGLVNAVVHRSYSMMGDHIRIEIFPNRVEIYSPGRFPGIADPRRPLQISRYARNPRIARVCADLGITRELGEGITRMFTEMQRRGLSAPIYTQSAEGVRLTLLASDAVPADVLARLTPSARQILDALRLSGTPLGTGQLAETTGVTRMTATRALNALTDEGLVTWQGTSKRDPRAVWALT